MKGKVEGESTYFRLERAVAGALQLDGISQSANQPISQDKAMLPTLSFGPFSIDVPFDSTFTHIRTRVESRLEELHTSDLF
jgi:hypothetical protein